MILGSISFYSVKFCFALVELCVFCGVRFRIITAPGVEIFIEIEFPFHL